MTIRHVRTACENHLVLLFQNDFEYDMYLNMLKSIKVRFHEDIDTLGFADDIRTLVNLLETKRIKIENNIKCDIPEEFAPVFFSVMSGFMAILTHT